MVGLVQLYDLSTSCRCFTGLNWVMHTVVSRFILVAMLDRASQIVKSQSARRRFNIDTGVVLFILVGLILIT